MAKKVSKNSKIAQRGQSNAKDFVKVVKPVKNPITGKYTYKVQIVHKDNTKAFFAEK
jgi:hypothetical protein